MSVKIKVDKTEMGFASLEKKEEGDTMTRYMGPVYPMTEYVEELYSRQVDAKRAALDAAYRKSVAELNAAEAALAPNYQAAKNRAAGQADVQKRSFDEYAAASGINTGTAAQSRLASGLALQNDLSSLDAGESSARAELNLKRAGLSSDYAAAVAQAEAEGASDRARALFEEAVRVRDMENQANLKNAELESKAALQKAELEAEADRKNAELEARYGNTTQKSAGASGGSSYTGTAGNTDTGPLEGLFTEMERSGAPYTYLVTNASRYGLGKSSTSTLGEVYDEYKRWAEGKAVFGGYTAREKQNYDQVLSRLAISSARQGSDPLAYIEKLTSVVDKDYYIDLMGEALFQKLRETVPAYAAAYAQLLKASDPAAWLKANGSLFSQELENWLAKQI